MCELDMATRCELKAKRKKLAAGGGSGKCKIGKRKHTGRPGLTNKKAGTTGRGRLGAKCSNKSIRKER